MEKRNRRSDQIFTMEIQLAKACRPSAATAQHTISTLNAVLLEISAASRIMQKTK
jgi:hypothetical protein